MKRILMATALSLSFTTSAFPDDWGCKLLLCFANPAGWQTVPDCHPPVEAYLACANLMFGACPFPTCPEGGGSGLGYQQFDDCPAGYTPTSSGAGNTKGFTGAMSTLDSCTKTLDNCNAGMNGNGKAFNSGNNCTETIPRPVKPNPYHIEITDSQTHEVKSYWFNLNH